MEINFMRIGVASHYSKDFIKLLNSLPDVAAEFQQPFGCYDATVGFEIEGARQIVFDPEKENLSGFFYPVSVDYQKDEPNYRLDRAVCEAPVKLIRRWESLFNEIGKLAVFETYQEVREIIHPSIAVEQLQVPSQGIQVILESGYKAKKQLLTAIIRKQPFLVYEFDGVSEILKSLHCLSPWMLPFSTISDALTRLDLLRMSTNTLDDLERARQRCLSKHLHYNNLHIWLKAIYE
jgi:hypothetical protein